MFLFLSLIPGRRDQRTRKDDIRMEDEHYDDYDGEDDKDNNHDIMMRIVRTTTTSSSCSHSRTRKFILTPFVIQIKNL